VTSRRGRVPAISSGPVIGWRQRFRHRARPSAIRCQAAESLRRHAQRHRALDYLGRARETAAMPAIVLLDTTSGHEWLRSVGPDARARNSGACGHHDADALIIRRSRKRELGATGSH
jgi:hypothetical protein